MFWKVMTFVSFGSIALAALSPVPIGDFFIFEWGTLGLGMGLGALLHAGFAKQPPR